MALPPAIEVRELSKQFLLGQTVSARSAGERLMTLLSSPWRRLRGGEHRPGPESIWAIDNLSFDVPRGQILGIIGANGAGKSTLLRILSSITEPTSGTATLRGRVGSLLEVGTGFHPELTGRENIFLNGAILGMKKREIARKFEAITAFAEVDRFLDTPVKRYSSGMYMRLAFSVAAHLEPEILLVDEVLAVGDVAFQRKCLGRMEQVAHSGRTILFVSHNMAAVKAICERVIVLSAGRIEADGPATEVVDGYLARQLESPIHLEAGLPVRHGASGLTVLACSADLVLRDGAADLSLVLTLEAPTRLRDVGIGLEITSADGVCVSKLAPVLTNTVIRDLEGSATFELRCPRISERLGGGTYRLGIWLSKAGLEYLIRLPGIAKMDLPASDPYGTGEAFTSAKYGLVPLPLSLERVPGRQGGG